MPRDPANAAEDHVLKAEEEREAARALAERQIRAREERENQIFEEREAAIRAHQDELEIERLQNEGTSFGKDNSASIEEVRARQKKYFDELYGKGSEPEPEQSAPPPTRSSPTIQEEDEETDADLKITRVINGKKVTRTVAEWTAIASKVEDADAYLTEAAAKVYNRAPTPPPVTLDTNKARELAKKISMGTEDEAAAATIELAQLAANQASEASRAEAQKAAGAAVYDRIVADYADLFNDPIMSSAIVAEDTKLMKANKLFDADPVKNFDKRLRSVCETVKAWKLRNTQQITVKQKNEEVKNKKAKMQVLQTNNGRTVGNGSRQQNEMSHDEAAIFGAEEIIAARRAARGGL